MNFDGTEVEHKKFGKGKIVDLNERHIEVDFEGENKFFSFPSSFSEGFLSTSDASLIKKIAERSEEAAQEALIKEKIIQERNRMRDVMLCAIEPPVQMTKNKLSDSKKSSGKTLSGAAKAKKSKGKQAGGALKCIYCNGGATKAVYGYSGVCTDNIIKYNINKEKHAVCSREEGPCKQYYDEKINREQLDSVIPEGGFVCSESQTFIDWKVYVDTALTKEQLTALNAMKKNSLAVLTCKLPNTKEEERIIFAVFIVAENSLQNEGQTICLSAEKEYFMAVVPSDTRKIKFWDYCKSSTASGKAQWRSSAIKSLDEIVCAQILRDIAEIKLETPEAERAENLYKHFCGLSNINPDELPLPSGVLLQSFIVAQE